MKSFSENRVALGYEQKKFPGKVGVKRLKKKKTRKKTGIKRRDKIKKMG
jgi:hypothetical protein